MVNKLSVLLFFSCSLIALQNPPPLKPQGIINQGNTCYMNAAIQCLYNIEPLTHFLLSKLNTPFYKTDESIIINGAATDVKTVAYEYSYLVNQLRNNSTSSVAPIPFCQRMWPALKNIPGVQGDAEEFITILLEHLCDRDINRNSQTTYFDAPYGHMIKGMPGTLFYFIQNTVLMDKRTLDMERPLTRIRKEITNRLSVEIVGPTLEECLNNYFKLDDEVEDLPDTVRKLRLSELSPYLIITLKRFRDTLEKIDDPVKLKFILNMQPYVLNNNGLATYELVSFVLHGGSFNGGHYTAYVKNNDNWFLCDDSSTTLVNDISGFETLGKENAASNFTPYILFYKKIIPKAAIPDVRAITLEELLAMQNQIQTLSDLYASL